MEQEAETEKAKNEEQEEREMETRQQGLELVKVVGARKEASSAGKRKIKVEKGKIGDVRGRRRKKGWSLDRTGRIVFGVVRAASDNVQNRGGKLAEAHWERDMVSNGWDGKKTKESFRNREERRTGVKYKRHRKQ